MVMGWLMATRPCKAKEEEVKVDYSTAHLDTVYSKNVNYYYYYYLFQ